jgi:hypothetical protein
MKKITTLAASVALLGLAVIPALATGTSAGNNCQNGTTGPLSSNTCTINNTSNVTVNNVNDSVIVNDVTSRANTGGNHADMNTLGGSIVTGNATLNSTVTSVAGVNTTNITGGPAMGSNLGSNNVTGPYSDNNVGIQNEFDARVYNSNTSYVRNDVKTTAETGDNSASTNTGPGEIQTGNALLNTSVGTHVGDSLTNIQAGVGGAGGNAGWNGTTGPFSENSTTLNNSADVTVNNVNDSVVKNDVFAGAETGRNRASTNTLGGSIATGGAGAGVGVNTEAGINTTYIAVAMGGFGNAGGNLVTGPLSDGNKGTNDVYLNNEQNYVVDNWNNKCMSHNASTLAELLHGRDGKYFPSTSNETCDPAKLGVNNEVDAFANSGDNSASTGTGPGSIVDGAAQLVQTVVSHLNDTLVNIGN